MSTDAYLQQILNREALDTGIFSPVRGVQATLEPAIREWANRLPDSIENDVESKRASTLWTADESDFISACRG